MKKIILFLFILLGACSKPELEPCKCATFKSGWDIPSRNYVGYWQELTFCSGKKMIWLCPDSTWILDSTACWEELQLADLDSLRCK